MHIAAITTDPIVSAIDARRSDPVSGFSEEQRILLGHYCHILARQKYVEPVAANVLWNEARRTHYEATKSNLSSAEKNATFARIVDACFPADFARAVMDIANPPAVAPPVDPTMVRVAEALECIALIADAMCAKSTGPVVATILSRIDARFRK